MHMFLVRSLGECIFLMKCYIFRILQAVALAERTAPVILRWCVFENLYTVATKLGDSRYFPFITAPDTQRSNDVAFMNLCEPRRFCHVAIRQHQKAWAMIFHSMTPRKAT